MLFRALTVLLALAAGGATIDAQAHKVQRAPKVDKAPKADRDKGDTWVLLATRSVDLKKDNDRVELRSAGKRVKAIRIVAKDRLIDIRRVTVAYDGGKSHVEKQRMKLEHGDYSDPIDMRSEERLVTHVDLDYRHHIGAAGPAKVEIWGLQSREAALEPRRTPLPKGDGPLITKPESKPGEPMAGTGEVLFGVQEVGSSGDRDVFQLGRDYGRFSKIRLRALSGEVNIRELRVVYTGGDPDVLAINANIPANEQTPWFDLKGDRFIKEIVFVYGGAAGSRSRARIEVYGDYAESWYNAAAGTGAFLRSNEGWLYLGGKSPLFVSIRRGLGYETETISIARNRGFKNMRLDVKGRAITLNSLTIMYADGTDDSMSVQQRVDGGSSFGPIDLKPKPVSQIQVSYRSRIFDSSATARGYAFVEFWAR